MFNMRFERWQNSSFVWLRGVLQKVGFGNRVDDVLSELCLDGQCFFRMRMLKNKMSAVVLCMSSLAPDAYSCPRRHKF